MVGPDDFAFAVRNASGDWDPGPAPSVAVRPGAGVGGYDRVTLTFGDGAVKNTWLRVTVLAGGATGLAQDDVFYFGNAIGETGNSATDAVVNAADYGATRTAQRTGPAAIDAPCDFNRDGLVNAVDLSIVRSHQSSPLLPLLTAPPSIAPGAPAAAPATAAPAATAFSTTRIRPDPMKIQSLASLVGGM
jgi:hypothetical protein